MAPRQYPTLNKFPTLTLHPTLYLTLIITQTPIATLTLSLYVDEKIDLLAIIAGADAGSPLAVMYWWV